MAKPTHAVRKPPPAPSAPADADDWVQGAKTGAQAPRRPALQDTRGKVRVGRDGVERSRVHAWIPVKLERQLAHYCVEHDRELGDVVAEALTKLLGRSSKRA